MKKTKIFCAIVVLALVCSVLRVNYKTSREFRCLLENVEALAGNDQSSGNYRICYSKSKVSAGYTYYDCGTCQKVYDEKPKGDQSKCFY